VALADFIGDVVVNAFNSFGKVQFLVDGLLGFF
jgi:hypothetical protein